jgi:hypothetical protein
MCHSDEAKPKNLEGKEILHFVQDDKPTYAPVTLGER